MHSNLLYNWFFFLTIFLCIIAFLSDLSIAGKLDSLDNELGSRSLTHLEKRQAFTGNVSYTDVESNPNACGIPASNDGFFGAISGQRFSMSNCNQTIQITRGSNSVNITVIDSCADCNINDLTITEAAFSQLADLSVGVIECTWSFVQ
ncbi:Papain inhibitor [Gigaspora margarita]|uniref:Papain inhibitor n=1 Tax=Gigaspora margarita TaxID=4874 RepID=A0A8H4A5I5_GIGMA|nr:Papain inhibitor [Gigaspora margarita]